MTESKVEYVYVYLKRTEAQMRASKKYFSKPEVKAKLAARRREQRRLAKQAPIDDQTKTLDSGEELNA